MATSQQKGMGWILGSSLFIVIILLSLKLIYPFRYTEIIDQWASSQHLDPYLVASIIRSESHFRPYALSQAGAVGLMQITPTTALWIAQQLEEANFAVEDLYKPDINIRFGTWYLRYLLDQFNENVENALIAYNAGPSNLRRWQSGEGTIFPETAAYMAEVKQGWVGYRFLYSLPILGHFLRGLPF
jgi:soluble lytic murein transglycosylase